MLAPSRALSARLVVIDCCANNDDEDDDNNAITRSSGKRSRKQGLHVKIAINVGLLLDPKDAPESIRARSFDKKWRIINWRIIDSSLQNTKRQSLPDKQHLEHRGRDFKPKKRTQSDTNN